jgi:Ca-activated chloride channel family protein
MRKKQLLIVMGLLLSNFLIGQSGAIKGTVKDTEGNGVPFANIVLLQNGHQVAGTYTDFDGNYNLKPVPAGKFDVVCSSVGYQKKQINGVIINTDKTRFLDIILVPSSVKLEEIQVVEYKVPLISKSQTMTGGAFYSNYYSGGSNSYYDNKFYKNQPGAKKINGLTRHGIGGTVTAEDISKMSGRSAETVAATVGGVYQEDGQVKSIRGSRSEANEYYIDGIKVRGSLGIPKAAIEEVSIVLSGTPAKYQNKTDYNKFDVFTVPFLPSISVAKSETISTPRAVVHNEEYEKIEEKDYSKAISEPVSTFSIDVDAASYSNMRRFLNDGFLPPVNAVRIEEMINYFSYDYAQPDNEHPFSIYTELGVCPWNSDNQLLHIGLQGKKVETASLPASNIVFLLDVSGSMNDYNKLPLVKKAFRMLVNNLRHKDKVAIVVYAGSSGLVLKSTNGDQKDKIIRAIEQLEAGGSTAGGAGIELAYKVAKDNFIEGGNNRVILATDGDFNVGVSSNAELEDLIVSKRNDGVFLSVLGFGNGNYKDRKMETLADKGNGNFSYIDNLNEARKVFISEFGGTLFTIAKDVKIQIEFNPLYVKEYRLIGYENRMLDREDFDDDTKDAGELGSGHSVTALYEIVPNTDSEVADNSLKYQKSEISEVAKLNGEIGTVKFRYKQPDGSKSKLITHPISHEPIEKELLSDNYWFSSAVAGFGLYLRKSKYLGDTSLNELIQIAKSSRGDDDEGYRNEFLRLMKLAEAL